MLSDKKEFIAQQLAEGTGASISLSVQDVASSRRSGLEVWFSDIPQKKGPILELKPFGLRGHEVRLRFGTFSAPLIKKIRFVEGEKKQLAQALLESVNVAIQFDDPESTLKTWPHPVTKPTFRVEVRKSVNESEDDLVLSTCREVLVPIMGALAELIGYEKITEEEACEEPPYEGAVLRSVVSRRERNPRNRLLCLRLHGYRCQVCKLDPREVYGDEGHILEVHHIQPLSELGEPRKYDPKTDLVPLCPNCHRAIHSRKTAPFAVSELRAVIEEVSG